MVTSEQMDGPQSLRRLLVIGAGTMGRGIAQVGACAGFDVGLYDIDRTKVVEAIAQVVHSTARRVERGKLTKSARRAALDRLEPYDHLPSAAGSADIVVESVPEQMDVKVEVLTQARDAAPPSAILASNTSSLSITELGQRLDAGARIIGTHFFNPPTVMELLEIVRGLHTTAETLESARYFAKRLGKTAILVHDSPGFATSRLGLALGVEAMRMLETSVASVEDIDRAMELGYGHPMGPLKLSDVVGLDVRLAILEHLCRELGDRYRPPVLLRQMVRAGWLGRKSGRGFYQWTAEGPLPADPREL